MDTLKDLVGALRKIEGAIQGEDAVKTTMRTRIKDYRSVLQALQGSTSPLLQYEVERLQGLFKDIDDLHEMHTASPEDRRLARIAKRATRGIKHESIEEELDAIDKEVVRQFNAISAKSSVTTQQAVDTLLASLRPPTLPDMAAVPAGAVALPRSFIERSGVRAAVDGLLSPEKPLTPFAVVGMGGAGKTVLASAVVREQSVREHFRGGIFWLRVGRGANRSLLPLVQGLAREMGAAPTDSSHAVPHVFDGLEHVKQHLASVASTGKSRRLVVLDDVWEREVVDALLAVGLKVLVTTRDRSIVGVPGCCLELGNMTKDEALELLLKTSMTAGQPGNDVRTQMMKVFELCGGLPLALSIAGSMPIVKGKGFTAGAWKALIKTFTNVATKMEACGGELDSLGMALETSFNALSMRKKEALRRVAVLAEGAVAPGEMLLNLWEMEDEEGTREEADGLVSKCLLQDLGGGRYRAHDLVLEFLKIKIKADADKAKKTAVLQAQYLRRLDVVEGYSSRRHGPGGEGMFSLAAFWRLAEELSGDPELEVVSYRASLKELESCKATAYVALSYSSVGDLFMLQGKYAQAESQFGRSQAILEKALGPEHPWAAIMLSDRGISLEKQGKYAEAEPLLERSQAIREKILGPEHPHVAASIHSRATLLGTQGKHAEAEALHERSQAIREKVLGSEHPDLADSMHNRASVLESQGKYAEAKHLCERSLAIRERVLGPAHPDVAASLNHLAMLLASQGKFLEAEPLYERSQAIREEVLGSEHPDIADSLNNRAVLLTYQGKLSAAEPLYQRSQAMREKAFDPEHRDVAASLNNRAALLMYQGKYAEAAPLYERSQAIVEKALGPRHPHVATSLSNQAGLLDRQGKHAEAEALYERSHAIQEEMLSPEHPSVALSLSTRASLMARQGKLSEAEALFERSQAIYEKVFGPEHPFVAWSLVERASLLESQGKDAEAKPLYEQAKPIMMKVSGRDYPEVPRR